MAGYPSSSIANGVVRNGLFSGRAPSPPFVHVPTISGHDDPSSVIKPSYHPTDARLSVGDIEIITGGRTQHASNVRLRDEWRYEHRHVAQKILDYLYLGPTSAVRNLAWLKEHKITMLLVARDTSMVGMRSARMEKAVAELGVELTYVNLAHGRELIQIFAGTVDLINQHVLRLNTDAKLDPNTKPGKVLVMCDTGNERSAAIVTAYIMAMFGRDMVSAIQFVSAQRFCANYDETVKWLLLAYDDILQAKRMTTMTTLASRPGNAQTQPAVSKKRGIKEMADVDEEGDVDMDMARYEDRPGFVPFIQENMFS